MEDHLLSSQWSINIFEEFYIHHEVLPHTLVQRHKIAFSCLFFHSVISALQLQKATKESLKQFEFYEVSEDQTTFSRQHLTLNIQYAGRFSASNFKEKVVPYIPSNMVKQEKHES